METVSSDTHHVEAALERAAQLAELVLGRAADEPQRRRPKVALRRRAQDVCVPVTSQNKQLQFQVLRCCRLELNPLVRTTLLINDSFITFFCFIC